MSLPPSIAAAPQTGPRAVQRGGRRGGRRGGLTRRVVAAAVVLGAGGPGLAAAEPAAPLRYGRDIRPLLAEHCFACHGFDEHGRQADLRLDQRVDATAPRQDHAAIVPGDPAASLVVLRIRSDDPAERMPPPESGKTLTDDERSRIERWIAEGAAYEPHWAFERPRRGAAPEAPDAAHPVDRFVQSRLAAEGLAPSPLAEPAVQLRRVALDLVGLPPAPAEIDAFLARYAADPDAAWREAVERLLASPHYGERWGRWWLDQARYADSNGYSSDGPRSIWKYRDWVVAALNRDMPFDRFTVEQLAGDLLPEAAESQRVATGFHRNMQLNQEGGIDVEQFRIDSVFDRVATTGVVWLGLTLGCAQCHDHKFDPIRQREFYQLFAFFNNQAEPELTVYGPELDGDALRRELAAVEHLLESHADARLARLGALDATATAATRAALPEEARQLLDLPPDQRTPDQRQALGAALAEADPDAASLTAERQRLQALLAQGVPTLVLEELTTPRTTRVLIKGDFTRPGEEVLPGTPAVLHPLAATDRPLTRLDLAVWLTAPENPLTARVLVNRVWQVYFGRGLVETDSDFGLQGALPTHPELLDWLACEWVDRHWSLKELHRLIVTSHAYRQASTIAPAAAAADPGNALLGRQRRLRLDAELVRDGALAASGLLSPALGGPPIFPPVPAGALSQGQNTVDWPVSSGDARYRRGLYACRFRATPPPSFNAFDAPDGYSPCTRRERSNTPLQALALMNDQTAVECAEALAAVVAREGAPAAFRRCTSRWPDAEEAAVLESLDALTAARVLLNLDESITRE